MAGATETGTARAVMRHPAGRRHYLAVLQWLEVPVVVAPPVVPGGGADADAERGIGLVVVTVRLARHVIALVTVWTPALLLELLTAGGWLWCRWMWHDYYCLIWLMLLLSSVLATSPCALQLDVELQLHQCRLTDECEWSLVSSFWWLLLLLERCGLLTMVVAALHSTARVVVETTAIPLKVLAQYGCCQHQP